MLTRAFACLVLGLITVYAVACDTGPHEYPSATVTTDDSPCATTEGDAAEMIQAAKERDADGYYSLGKKRGNHLLESGTRVRVLLQDHGLSYVHIESGKNRADACWIPDHLLTR